MKKHLNWKIALAAVIPLVFAHSYGNAQETLQTVTDRGATTSNDLTILSSRPQLFLKTNAGNSQLIKFWDGEIPRMELAYDALVNQMYLFAYNTNSYFSVYTAARERFRISPAGDAYFLENVGIGTTTPKEKLAVNGNIRAKEIKVEMANWPDYVFAPEYQNTSLAELEKFIKMNKHLPDMPTAKEVEEHGVSLGEMNKVLLKKVEELTLHLIEKDKDIQLLKVLTEEQHKQIKSILNTLKKEK